MNAKVVLSGVGLWTPPYKITNQELVESYNAWAEAYNQKHQAQIEAGELTAKPFSSAEFIEKASGIKSRYIYRKEGALDIERMRPKIPERGEGELSNQAEIAIEAAKLAMADANKTADEIDAVIVSCAYTQRSYPAIAIEVQNELGIDGFGFDMLVACSAATFGMHRAWEMIASGNAKCVLVINPELVSPQVNTDTAFDILSTKAKTMYSNNIRSNFGYMSRANDADPFGPDKLFHQAGRRVFKEVCPMAAEHIASHLGQHELTPNKVNRWWLHQANINMNTLICKKLLGRDANSEEAPIVLDEYANTASAGSIIAFALHHQDLASQDVGVICSFGAGYSIGSLVVRKR